MKVIVNNLATEFEDEGTGPVLLFLHGWKDSLKTFAPLVPGLASDYRVVRLDLPGFGGSEMPSRPWSVSDYVAFVHDPPSLPA